MPAAVIAGWLTSLLDGGYENISVLDISERAIELARHRLGARAEQLTWIVSDVLEFEPVEPYDVWHDRATFHFLTDPNEIERYVAIVSRWVARYLSIATFSDRGPERCSGLDVTRYSEESLDRQLGKAFRKLCCITEDHTTSFGTQKNFLFCAFARRL
jgi:hypothetical protein